MNVGDLMRTLQAALLSEVITTESRVFFLEECIGDGNVVLVNEIIIDEDGDIVLGSDEI